MEAARLDDEEQFGCDIVIVAPEDRGTRMARDVIIDGHHYFVPSDSPITTHISDMAPLTLTVTLFASNVRYVDEWPE